MFLHRENDKTVERIDKETQKKLLLEMGVKGLETEVDRSRFEDEHGKDHQVIDHFMIYAVK